MWTEQKKKRLEKQLKIHENRLQILIDDYEVLSTQISYETNEQNKNVIRRRIASVKKEIKEAENEQRIVYSELQSLPATSSVIEPVRTAISSTTSTQKKPNSRVSRTVLQSRPRPQSKLHQPTSGSQNSRLIWRYSLYTGMTILLITHWLFIEKVAVSSIASNIDDIPYSSISAHLSNFGGIGGAFTGGLLYFHTLLQRYLQQRCFKFNLAKLAIYFAIAVTACTLLWYIPEALIYDNGEGDPMQYTSGAVVSARWSIAVSIMCLWLLSRMKSRIGRTQ